MDNYYFKSKEFIRLYTNKEIVLGRFPLELRFKELHRARTRKQGYLKWTMALSFSALALYSRPLSQYFLRFLLWAALSLLSIPFYLRSIEYYKLAASLLHKYKPMSELGIKDNFSLTYKERYEMMKGILK